MKAAVKEKYQLKERDRRYQSQGFIKIYHLCCSKRRYGQISVSRIEGPSCSHEARLINYIRPKDCEQVFLVIFKFVRFINFVSLWHWQFNATHCAMHVNQGEENLLSIVSMLFTKFSENQEIITLMIYSTAVSAHCNRLVKFSI